MPAITLAISASRALVADGRLVAGESADVSVLGGVPAALYLVDAVRDVVAACTSFVPGETSGTGVLDLATVPLAELVADIPAGRAVPLQAIVEDAAGAVIGYGLVNVVSAPMPDALDPLDIDLYIRAADIRALFADVPTAYPDQRNLSDTLSQVVGILQRIGLCAALCLGLRASATEWQDVPADTLIGDGLALTNGAIVATAQGGGITTNNVLDLIDEVVPSQISVEVNEVVLWVSQEYVQNVEMPDYLAPYALSASLGTAAYRDASEFATAADVASVTQRVDVASSAVVRYASGVLALTIPAGATLSADPAGWPDGAAVFARVTASGSYSVAQGLSLIGYGFWPTNSASVVFLRSGGRVLVNVMEGN